MPVLDPQALIRNRITAIQDYHDAVGTKKAELDVSGGVDSAVMLGLLAGALGPKNVIAVYQGINSSTESLERAREVAVAFNVPLVELDLSSVFSDIVSEMWKRTGVAYGAEARDEADARRAANPLIDGSLRSCIRAPVGRYLNRVMGGGIRHGTGNEDEDRWTRFFQKGGDGEVDTNPIAMLSKGEVYQLAIALGVPASIVAARPSPDLWGDGEGHNDEAEYANYFGFEPGEHTFYSYVDAEDGRYVRTGLIERVSRWLDLPCSFKLPYTNEQVFFHREGGIGDDTLIAEAIHEAPLRDIPSGMVGLLLVAARRIERDTRHKFNPNIPTLGTRRELVDAGILTDTLPTPEVTTAWPSRTKHNQ